MHPSELPAPIPAKIVETQLSFSGNFEHAVVTPNQLRWRPFTIPTDAETDFIRGLTTICGAGRYSLRPVSGFACLLLSELCTCAAWAVQIDIWVGACQSWQLAAIKATWAAHC